METNAPALQVKELKKSYALPGRFGRPAGKKQALAASVLLPARFAHAGGVHAQPGERLFPLLPAHRSHDAAAAGGDRLAAGSIVTPAKKRAIPSRATGKPSFPVE